MAKKQPRTDADRRARQCERLGRLLQTLQLITSKGRWDADGLAAELECSRRTVYRMLQTLSMAGVPWYFDEQSRAYRVRPGFKFPVIEPTTPRSAQPASLPSDLEPMVEKLIADGEAFVQTLQSFLVALKR
jgi:predicted DNA-binding transcriptional regulator YafY